MDGSVYKTLLVNKLTDRKEETESIRGEYGLGMAAAYDNAIKDARTVMDESIEYSCETCNNAAGCRMKKKVKFCSNWE